MDSCVKSSGFTDFENTEDRGSVMNFGADSGFVPFFILGSWVLNELWIIDLSSVLVGLLMSSSKFVKHVYLWTFTLWFLDVVAISDLNKNIGGSMELVKKRHGSADLNTPIHPQL